MRSQKRVDFKVHDETYISYGDRVREVRGTQGINPEDFCQIYDKLCKHGLAITEEFLSYFYDEALGKTLTLSERQKLPFPYINHLVGFILDVGYLLGKGVGVEPLIKEFNESKSLDELHHCCHLSGLAAMCVTVGHKIDFPKKGKNERTADFVVDGICADLKLVRPP